jgi:hypothetical protein
MKLLSVTFKEIEIINNRKKVIKTKSSIKKFRVCKIKCVKTPNW